MAIYCPLVSVGCYCIVEDTKMSRWSSDGPLASVHKFLKKHPEFELVSAEGIGEPAVALGVPPSPPRQDRKRELLYSHHTFGYLKRIK